MSVRKTNQLGNRRAPDEVVHIEVRKGISSAVAHLHSASALRANCGYRRRRHERDVLTASDGANVRFWNAAETAGRIVVVTLASAPHDESQQVAHAALIHPAGRVFRSELVARKPPDLLCVGTVEQIVEWTTQAAYNRRLVGRGGLGPRSPLEDQPQPYANRGW